MTRTFSSYAHENGGRVLLLFLLFFLALYQFYSSGFSSFTLICLSPVIVIATYIVFNNKMLAFWALFAINYLIQFLGMQRLMPSGIPTSLYNELLQILLLAVAIIDSRQSYHFERITNIMLFALLIWATYCTLQIFNNTCNLGIDIGSWYTGARMMSFQLLYTFLVFSIYISSPELLSKYLKVWAFFSLFSVYWTWQQQYLGFTHSEKIWLDSGGIRTHFVNGIIRYWSTFSDAANYGCNAAATSLAFFIVGITTSVKRDKIFFLFTAVTVIWGMFASGTRTAIFCFIAGFMAYMILSKSIKIIIPSAIVFSIFMFILIFTTIGQGNAQIRRMRSAFNKNDASANVRDINQATMRKYLKDAPWGIGLGGKSVPANNKYNRMSTIAPDSEYVYIWIHTGRIGLTIFIITMLIMLGGACWIVMFRIKNKSLIGIGAGFCCAFISIQIGGYANQVLMQFPNCLLFYGGLSIVYILPYIEPEWNEYEKTLVAKQEEKKRLKLEKELASRV